MTPDGDLDRIGNFEIEAGMKAGRITVIEKQDHGMIRLEDHLKYLGIGSIQAIMQRHGHISCCAACD
jgi:hypothetical protein